MNIRSSDVILLLGAGTSVDAGIPAAATMIQNIESLIKNHPDWEDYTDLYHHVKSAIYFSSGIKGRFSDSVLFNIETLVNTLYELERNEEHPLYPFIASWNSRFVLLAENDFRKIKSFRRMILKELKRWVCPEKSSLRQYYSGIKTLQESLGFPLSIFSLNYDLCVESLSSDQFRIESGFEQYGSEHFWNWERFEPAEGPSTDPPQVYLFKLHGSINWKRDDNKNLFCVEQIESVEADKMDIIFGRDFKLEAADPYLFYAYQFRRSTMDSKLIITIGYSFSDSHINKMLTQGLKLDKMKKLHVVTYGSSDSKSIDESKKSIAEKLEINIDQISVETNGAKAFLGRKNLGQQIIDLVPKTSDAPF